MTFEIGFVLVATFIMLIMLIINVAKPSIIIFLTLSLFLLTGIIAPEEALRGFSNQSVITIALLFIVTNAIKKVGVFYHLIEILLNNSKNPKISFLRLILPVSLFSAFLNNTPITMMFIPVVKKWCNNKEISPSKFLLPLSYASIFGGMLTLIGSSTNLVVHGMMLENQLDGFSMFQLSIIGVPASILGIFYLFFFGYDLLPSQVQTKYQEDISSISSFVRPRMTNFKTVIVITTFILMVFLVAFRIFTTFQSALIAVIILILTKIISPKEIKNIIDFNVLILIASSFGVGVALNKTGAGFYLVYKILQWVTQFGLIGIILFVYIMTNLITEVINNNGAAMIMFPVVLEIAHQLNIEPTPLMMTLTIAASASFSTPIGYQTNLLVYRPGGYKFSDYIKVGLPLNFIFMAVTVFILGIIYG
ncbi:hypothetical protein BHF71_02780 [Vulcanibacillus modesticaldus]|uniref:Citrate transporter-like domain-containing protein n=1 Tax=Vulcanibacillus modesticaldus TaxID=337097 RepID=A0A1D2YT60_9BACI|nr:SLC13 family permease [Vulcanibacillus modesticaldus]OEF98869.1 hypothetical protein BHF71_02780 [Vulcanibacillus modesticaldus]